MKKTLNQVNTQDNTLYDFIYDLIFFMSLKESEEDIKNGRVIRIVNIVEKGNWEKNQDPLSP